MNIDGAPLKYIAGVRVSSVDKKSVDGQIPVRLCNYTDVYYRESIAPDQEFMAATATPEQVERFRLVPGDTVITKDSETPDDIGIASFVTRSAPDLVCGYHLAVIRPDSDVVDPRYLFWALRSRGARAQFSAAATGVTRFGLRTDAIKSVRVHVSSLDEQRSIASFLDAESTAAIAAARLVERRILLLEERREALTTAAVTGALKLAPSPSPTGP